MVDSYLENVLKGIIPYLFICNIILDVVICVFCIAYGIYMRYAKHEKRGIKFIRRGAIWGAVIGIMGLVMKVSLSLISHNCEVDSRSEDPGVSTLFLISWGILIGFSIAISAHNNDKDDE